MCCTGPKWKREVVPDHKFDFVDTREFIDNGFMMRAKYLWLYIIVLKSFLVYISDIFSAITMMTTDGWANDIFDRCLPEDSCITVSFTIGKWIFFGSIIFGFLLLGYETHKSKKIIASRDISYAFTNVIAHDYYSLRSYGHFCFFDHISSSTKTSDDFAFFIFFAFKSWKRLLLSDAPRQTINALTLFAVYKVKSKNPGPWYDVTKYFDGNSLSTSALTITAMVTVTIFLGSLLILIAAAVCYIPLLMHIRGNLKEYCCHKVDKRIDAVIKRRQKQRLVDEAKKMQKEAAGDFSHLKNKKGEIVGKPLPQPTLPSVKLDDDLDDTSSYRTKTPGPPGSIYTHNNDTQYSNDAASGYYNNYYYNEKSTDYIPPMPAYNPYSTHQAGDAQFQASQPSLGGVDYRQYYDDDQDSQAHLATHQTSPVRDGGARAAAYQQQAYASPADVYGARTYSPAPSSQYAGIAYDQSSMHTSDVYAGYSSGYSGAALPASRNTYDSEHGIGRKSPGPGRL